MKISMNKLARVFLMCILPLIMLSFSPGSIDRVKAWEKVINSHQIESTLALYADNATIDYAGIGIFNGKDEIKGFLEWNRVMNIRLSLSNIGQTGDTLSCSGTENSDWLKAANLNEQSYASIKFTFTNGLISFQQVVLSPESFQAHMATSHAIQEWAEKERSQQVREMMASGKFVYNATTAKTNLNFVREWRKTTKTK